MSRDAKAVWREFGRRLRATRKAKGWTQETLARVTGLAQNSISTYERGHTPPSVETLATLAAALDTTMDALWPTRGRPPASAQPDPSTAWPPPEALTHRLAQIEARLWDLYAYVEVMAEVLQATGVDIPVAELQSRFQRYRAWIAATQPGEPPPALAPRATEPTETADPRSKA